MDGNIPDLKFEQVPFNHCISCFHQEPQVYSLIIFQHIILFILCFCSCKLGEFRSTGLVDGKIPDLTFEQVPFNHPLYIMYSSGTTGVPKCMVHSVGVSYA